LDARSSDRLGDDRGAPLEAPHQENLLYRFTLVVGEFLQLLILVKRRVGGAEAGVGGGVDALLFAVVKKLRPRTCQLVYSMKWVIQSIRGVVRV
jgi:hypothetical protein